MEKKVLNAMKKAGKPVRPGKTGKNHLTQTLFLGARIAVVGLSPENIVTARTGYSPGEPGKV
jgi:hypothetical protein